jgi:hypothetical protein
MITDIWQSFRRLPLWVQIWVAFLLVPINFAALFFWTEPGGAWIAFLAVAGIAPNGVVLLVERGFGRAMAFSHLVFWPVQLVLIASLLWQGDVRATFHWFLWGLLAVNTVSLVFDLRDAAVWLRGQRGAA